METPTFKDVLKNDVTQVFLNPDEFGEHHRVNGKDMVIVLDDIENIEREKRMKSNMDGIHTHQILFYVSSEGFGKLPAEGDLLDLDRQRFTVVDATDECGIYAITIEANKSKAGRRSQ